MILGGHSKEDLGTMTWLHASLLECSFPYWVGLSGTYESTSPNLALEIKISIPIPILGGTFSIQNMNNEQSATDVLVMKGLKQNTGAASEPDHDRQCQSSKAVFDLITEECAAARGTREKRSEKGLK